MKKFHRIAVLFGGPSNERQVSLASGAAVAKALKQKGYDVVEIDTDAQTGCITANEMPGVDRCPQTRPVTPLDGFEHGPGVFQFAGERVDPEALCFTRGLEAGGDVLVMVRSAHWRELPELEGDELASISAARVASWLR